MAKPSTLTTLASAEHTHLELLLDDLESPRDIPELCSQPSQLSQTQRGGAAGEGIMLSLAR